MIGRYPLSVRCPSVVRPSVVIHNFKINDISSEAVWPKLLIFGINSQEGGTKNVVFLFRSDKNSGCHGNLYVP